MKKFIQEIVLLIACITYVGVVNAQLPNEKFGKPSAQEWEFVGWGDAVGADAIILCKTMKATYQLSDQVANYNNSFSDINADNITDFSKNSIDQGNILVKYEFRLRTKVLKPEGAKHANIDITYFNADNEKMFNRDELTDLKIKVFSKNQKGKIEKRRIDTRHFVSERVDNNYMVMHVVVPDVEPGSIIEYEYDITSNRPTYLYNWLFQEDIPTVRSKCDIEIPAFLQFNMNAPINKLVKSSVVQGRLPYDSNRSDLKRGKYCVSNHYNITGDYILPEGQLLTHNQGTATDKQEKAEGIAPFTSMITTMGVTLPAHMPEGHTHLKVK